MGYGTILQTTSAKDYVAGTFVARFTSSEPSASSYNTNANARYATHVMLATGETPSYAFAALPTATPGINDSVARGVAMALNGPANAIKLLSRAAVDYVDGNNTITVLCGTCVECIHDLGDDSATLTIIDDRLLLSKITVFGRMTYNPQTAKYYFDAAAQPIFNERNIPDCIDSPNGPCFAPSHFFGYLNQDQTEPAPGAATVRARSWRVTDVISYLRNYTNKATLPPMQMDYGNQTLSGFVNWPQSIGSVFGTDRFVHNFSLHNDSLLVALSKTLRRAGAYDLYCEPAGTYRSTLAVHNMNPNTSSGIGLYLPAPADDLGQLMRNPSVIESGHIVESARNYSDNVAIIGDSPMVERFISTSNSGVTLAAGAGDNMLSPGWTTQEETLLKNFIANYSNPNSQAAAEAGWKQYQYVYAVWHITPGADVWKNTAYAGLFNGNNGRIGPTQLTATNMNQNNPGNWFQIPLGDVIEYEATPGAGDWFSVTAREGSENPATSIKISPCGEFIFMEGLRKNLMSWNNTNSNMWNGATMQSRNIRLNLALAADFCIVGRNNSDPNSTARRVKGGNNWTFTAKSETQDYIHWERQGSHPHGIQAIAQSGGAATYDNFPDAVLFDDTTRLNNHAALRVADVKNVELTGTLTLGTVNPAIRPGMGVTINGANVMPNWSVVKSVTHNTSACKTLVELYSADRKELYDAPIPMKSGYDEVSSGGKNANDDYDYTGFKKQSDKYDSSGKATAGKGQRDGDPDAGHHGVGAAGAAGGDGAEGMNGGEGVNKRGRGRIIQGQELEDRQRLQGSGDQEKGIFNRDDVKAEVDEQRARGNRRGPAKSTPDIENVKSVMEGDVKGNETAQERRKRENDDAGLKRPSHHIKTDAEEHDAETSREATQRRENIKSGKGKSALKSWDYKEGDVGHAQRRNLSNAGR